MGLKLQIFRFVFWSIAGMVSCAATSNAQDCNFTIGLPQDITICTPGTINIQGSITGEYFSYQWTGTNGFEENATLNPSILITETTTLTLSVLGVPSSNQIVNGDFSSGNTGFTTDYSYVQDNPGSQSEMYPEGTYTIVTNPNYVHNGFSACGDHTGGGNMMVVNGASALQEVWCQTVNVNPNSNYIFQAFATSVNPASPAILQFAINGVLMDSPFALSGTVCEWEEFYTIWNSGSNTSIEICITNQNTAAGGNDFAIDDIFFSEFCEDEEQMTIFLQEFEAEISPATILTCSQPNTTVTAYTVPYNSNCDYQWNTQNGSITTSSGLQTIGIDAGGTYTVTITDAAGCTREASVEIEEDTASPDIALIGDALISCTIPTTTLYAASSAGNGIFTWVLPDGSTRQGEAIEADQPGTFVVTTTGQNGCSGSASLDVEFQAPVYQYLGGNEGPLTCTNNDVWAWVNVQSPHDSIRWQGPGIQGFSSSLDSVRVNAPGYYIFTIFTGQNCHHQDSIFVSEIPANIDYRLSLPSTITCKQQSTSVWITPISPVSLMRWYLNGSLIATGDTLITSVPGNYHLEIFDTEGCKKSDTIRISGDLTLPEFTVTTDSIRCTTMNGGFMVDGAATNDYQWKAPDGSVVTSRSPRFTETGEYVLTITGANGCKIEKIYFLPSAVNFPRIDISADTITCDRPLATIQIVPTENAVISWTGPENQSGNSTTIQTSLPGMYQVRAVNAGGCVSQKNIRLEIDTLKPHLELSPSYTITCLSSSANPSVLANHYQSFFWKNPDGSENSTSLAPTLSIPGKYSLTLRNKNGCQVTSSCQVIYDTSPPAFTATADDLTCLNPETRLKLAGSVGLRYLDPAGNDITEPFIIRTEGMYPIKAVGLNGCDSTILLKVKAFLDAPSPKLDTLTLNCRQPEGFVRDLLFEVENEYFWDNGSGSFQTDSFLVTRGKNITLTVVNQYGCRKNIPVPVAEDFTAPKAVIDGPGVIPCQESSIRLLAGEFNAAYSYSWQNIAGEKSFEKTLQVAEAGEYSLSVLNLENGCSSQAVIKISKMTGPSIELPSVRQPICFGEEGILTLSNPSGGQPPFIWTLDRNKVVQDAPLNVSPGNHVLLVTDAHQCTAEAEIVIESPADFSVFAGRDTLIAYSDQLTLAGITSLKEEEIRSIEWQPADIFTCNTCLRPTISPDSDVRCFLEVTDKNGCVHSDEVFVRVRFDKGVIAPNIFTPGGNSSNQRFTLFPVKSTIEKIDVLHIYDRWGNLVFKTENIEAGNTSLGWDGTQNGNRLMQGVYTWVAMITYKDQSSEWMKGDVTLLE